MQKVERRSPRGIRRRLWLAAAFILLAGSIAAAVALTQKTKDVIPAAESHTGLLIDRAAEELASITVQRRGEKAWTLIRTGDGLLIPEDGGEWNVPEQTGETLTAGITQLRYEEILSEDPEEWQGTPEDFGLAEPRVTVTGRYTDGQSATVRIGNETGLEEGWFYMALEGDEKLYAVSSGIAEELDVEYALLHPVPRPEILGALLDRITVTDRNGTCIAEWTLRGQITDRDAGQNWVISVPFTCPADEEAISNLKKNAENLRLGVYTAAATEENLEAYGLAVPERTLEFHMAAGTTGTVGDSGVYDVADHEESTVRLYIGRSRDELADYVRFGEEIFTVSHFTLSVFSEADPMTSAARYPVLTPLDSLESLTVDEGGKQTEYVLRETSAEEEGTVRECLRNGEAIAYAAFEAAYERLLTVTFSGTLPEGAEWQEAYKKYTFRTLSGGTHTVTLSDWDGLHDAVTVDGSTMFYLIRDGMTDLP